VKVKERCVKHKEILTVLLTMVPGIMIKEQIGHTWVLEQDPMIIYDVKEIEHCFINDRQNVY
jgi:hypothetical protein